MTSSQPIHPDDFVSDIAVDIGLALREHLDERYPGKVLDRLPDSPLATVRGRSIFVPSSESFTPAPGSSTTTQAAERILPLLQRDLHWQLPDAGLTDSDGWGLAYAWDGHSLFADGQFVKEGFRFDAYLEVVAAR